MSAQDEDGEDERACVRSLLLRKVCYRPRRRASVYATATLHYESRYAPEKRRANGELRAAYAPLSVADESIVRRVRH